MQGNFQKILKDITIEKPYGEKITIDAGTTVEGFFDLDINELIYCYSFIQDDRVDLAVGAGVNVIPMVSGLRVSGLADEEGSADFTTPLPVSGLRMDVALNPQWFVRTGSQVFYVEYANFRGLILQFNAAVEYAPGSMGDSGWDSTRWPSNWMRRTRIIWYRLQGQCPVPIHRPSIVSALLLLSEA